MAGKNFAIPLTRAIPEHIRDGLRQCTIHIDVYFTLSQGHSSRDGNIYKLYRTCTPSNPLEQPEKLIAKLLFLY